MERTVNIEGVGDITLKKDKRFRRLSIRMAPNKGVWVNIPRRMNFVDGEEIIKENIEWIKRNLNKIRIRESKQTIFSSQTPFSTRYHKLKITESGNCQLTARLGQGLLSILKPRNLPEQSSQVQQFIHKAIIETLRREAQYYLPQRVKQLALEHNFSYKCVKVRNAKTRWGSCSFDNNLNLNIHLMRLPQRLTDYVILHELCHTVEKNHSSSFWNLMREVCPQVENYRSELKGYSTTLF